MFTHTPSVGGTPGGKRVSRIPSNDVISLSIDEAHLANFSLGTKKLKQVSGLMQDGDDDSIPSTIRHLVSRCERVWMLKKKKKKV